MERDGRRKACTFPDGFLWGVATAAHQVEGDNRNSDWWAWEHRPGTPVAEPSSIDVPPALAPVTRALVNVGLLRRRVLPPLLRRGAWRPHVGRGPPDRHGYEYRPRAVAATVRRIAEVFPGKDIVVTEHGIATTDDRERVAFITDGLAALHDAIGDAVPVRGYIHWAAFDNFEWALGYRMRFGIIAVDRTTQERRIKPSGRLLGEIARTNTLTDGGP